MELIICAEEKHVNNSVKIRGEEMKIHLVKFLYYMWSDMFASELWMLKKFLLNPRATINNPIVKINEIINSII